MSRLAVLGFALLASLGGTAAAQDGKARILVKRPADPIQSLRLVSELSKYGKQEYGLKLDGMITGKRRMVLSFSGDATQAKAFEAFIRKIQ